MLTNKMHDLKYLHQINVMILEVAPVDLHFGNTSGKEKTGFVKATVKLHNNK